MRIIDSFGATGRRAAGARGARAGAALVLLFAATLGLVSCSSDSKTASTPGVATLAGGTAPATGSPGAATSGSGVIDPASLQFDTLTDPETPYTIKMPTGWAPEDLPVPGGFARRYAFLPNGNRTAQVTVRCANGSPIDELQRADAALVGTINGTYGTTPVGDITIGGLSGKETTYTVPLSSTGMARGGQLQETRVVYLQGATCGWQILMQTFGTGSGQRYARVFDMILMSFMPTPAAG